MVLPNGSCGKRSLGLSKGLFSCRVPYKMLEAFFEEGCEGVNDGVEVPNEPPVEICEAKEMLEVFDSLGSGPGFHSSHFGIIHSYTLGAYVIS